MKLCNENNILLVITYLNSYYYSTRVCILASKEYDSYVILKCHRQFVHARDSWLIYFPGNDCGEILEGASFSLSTCPEH